MACLVCFHLSQSTFPRALKVKMDVLGVLSDTRNTSIINKETAVIDWGFTPFLFRFITFIMSHEESKMEKRRGKAEAEAEEAELETN